MQKDEQQDQHEEELENKLLVKKKVNEHWRSFARRQQVQLQMPKCGFFLSKSVKEKNGNDEHETKPNIKPLKNAKTKTESYLCKKNNQNQIGTKRQFF